MLKIERININLDRKNAIFHNGETMLGSLDFTIKYPIQVKSIKLIVNGYSQFEMTETDSNKQIRNITGFDPYLKFFINFLSPESYTGELAWLNSGDYSYRFEIKLPDSLPSSLNHPAYGETNYELKVIFDIPWSVNRTYERKFYVLNLLDLNDSTNELYKSEKNIESKKFYGVLCCKTKPLTSNFTILNKASFIPGEEVAFRVHLINLSRRKLTSMRVELKRKVIYNLPSKKSKHFYKSLTKVEHVFESGVEPGTNYTWDNGKLTIPICLPSLDDKTRLIQVIYELHLIIFSTFFTLRFTTIAGIRIGSIRLDALNDDSETRPFYNITDLDEEYIEKLICV